MKTKPDPMEFARFLSALPFLILIIVLMTSIKHNPFENEDNTYPLKEAGFSGNQADEPRFVIIKRAEAPDGSLELEAATDFSAFKDSINKFYIENGKSSENGGAFYEIEIYGDGVLVYSTTVKEGQAVHFGSIVFKKISTAEMSSLLDTL